MWILYYSEFRVKSDSVFSDYFVFDCSIAHPSATLQLESKDSDRELAVFLFPFIAHFDEDLAERATTSAYKILRLPSKLKNGLKT